MTPEDYLPLIRKTYPDEDANDVAKMMEILAEARAEARGQSLSREPFEFAGKILCVIFDPVKSTVTNFSRQTKFLRRAYRGIADSEDLQEMFRGSLRPELLLAETATQAIEAGVEALFRIPVLEDEGGFEDQDEWNNQR